MMLPPPYTAGAQPIDYSWDQADWGRSAQQKLKAQDEISGLRSRFLLALAIGMSEFVFRRQDPAQPQDLVFGNLVEAFWAAVIDRRYLKLVAKPNRYNAVKNRLISESTPLIGDIRTAADAENRETGPKWVAVSHLTAAVDRTTRTDGAALETVYVSNLAGQIVGKGPGPFIHWRRTVMKRFEAEATHSYFWLTPEDFEVPTNERNLLGPIIPPQVVDPDAPFTPGVATAWAKAFLEGLDPQANPFLTPADELLALGMDHPYHLAA
jgi:hypothetical protein